MSGTVEILPGTGTGAREGDLCVWMSDDSPDDLVAAVLAALRQPRALERVLDLLRAPAPGAIGVLAPGSGGWDVVLRGRVVAHHEDGTAWVGPADGGLARRQLAPGRVAVWSGGFPDLAPAGPTHDLRAGSVLAGGLLLRPTGPAAVRPPFVEAPPPPSPPPPAQPAPSSPAPSSAAAGPPAPSSPPAPSPPASAPSPPASAPDSPGGPRPVGSFAVWDLSVAPPPRRPLPVDPGGSIAAGGSVGAGGSGSAGGSGAAASHRLAPPPPGAAPDAVVVPGVQCANGHFNHWNALYCRVCGLGMIQASRVVAEGPRPALGVLVAPDGTTFLLDGDYLVGRHPTPIAPVRPVIVDDRRVSREHARIILSDWDVVVADLGSSNGTYVRNPGAPGWARVAPGADVVLEAAGELQVGSQVFVYESVLRR